jgi:hypothetical protein
MIKKLIGTLGALAFVATASNAFGTSRASLYLAGEIEVITNLFVNPEIGTIDTLDIVAGETARQVATVDEESNNAAGYRIDMESVNAGNLQHNDGTSNVPYTISYDGGAATAPGAVGTPAAVKTSGALTGLTTDNSTVEITFAAGGTTLPAGAYTDTLIFTMVAL